MVKQLQSADRAMDLFTHDDLDRLLAERRGPCVSLFMPMVRRGIETKGNPVRFKNMIDLAETRLSQQGLKAAEIGDLLEPARTKVLDSWFWQHQCEGLAAFLAPGEFHAWRLPLRFEEMVDVCDHFTVSPLAPMLTGDGTFYVLALAKGGVRLLECVRYTFREIELVGVPTSLPEELRYSIFQEGTQQHTAAMEGGGNWAAWHGHGATSDEAIIKDRVVEFFKHLDDGVMTHMGGSRAPLVLAGVEYMRGFYNELTHHPNVIEEGINASPEQMRDEELHRRAWSIVEPIFSKDRDAALELYRQRAGSGEGRVGKRLEEITPAAVFQRVDTLFIPRNTRVWGHYDHENNAVHVHHERENGDIDLLDLAASHTLRNRGSVYSLAIEDMPEQALAAALFRF